jgi:hypothetical protein
MLPFLTINAENGFSVSFKDRRLFTLTLKTLAIVYEVETIRMVPLSTPLFKGTGYGSESQKFDKKNGKVLIRTSTGYWISQMLF